jgi:hypothetical protein
MHTVIIVLDEEGAVERVGKRRVICTDHPLLIADYFRAERNDRHDRKDNDDLCGGD